jgi:hypothetical protein
MSVVKQIVIVSEGTGITARRLTDSILAHYADRDGSFTAERTFSGVRSIEQLNRIVEMVADGFLVVYSLIDRALREHFARELEARGVLHINILDPMREVMVRFLGLPTDYEAGRLQTSRGQHYQKMDAIAFSVEHDDGLGSRLEEADVVLVGPSRTVKTPTAMFISTHYGLKTANIPIIVNDVARDRLLQILRDIPRERIFGMVMKAELLAQVRAQRLGLFVPDEMDQKRIEGYQDVDEVAREITFCKRLYVDQDWEMIDVTGRSVEQIARTIVQVLHKR